VPDYGQVMPDDLGPATPYHAPLYPALPWTFEGVRVVKLAVEVGLDAVRALLPNPLSRSTPPFAALVVHDVPDSPFGPFRMACQNIICRYTTFVRAFVLQAVVDNPAAMAAFREVWSIPAKPGTVELGGLGASSSGRILSVNGSLLADWTLTNIEGAEAERVLLEPEITLRLQPDYAVHREAEPPRLVQVNRAYALRDPHRGRVSLRFHDGGPDYPWALLPITNSIVGVDTSADLHYDKTEYVLDYERQLEPIEISG
jgi:acetoacetate decarboxylase